MKKKIAITGHRPGKLGGDYDLNSPLTKWIKEEIIKVLEKEKPHYGISGMALGIDTLYCHILIELGIPFIAAVPCLAQERVWPEKARKEYHWLLSKAHKVEQITNRSYNKFCMQRRNEWMVDNCTKLIAVWDGTPGGTANCVNYAERDECPIIRINPNDFKNIQP